MRWIQSQVLLAGKSKISSRPGFCSRGAHETGRFSAVFAFDLPAARRQVVRVGRTTLRAGPETMTSRERVLAALNHEEPDQVPIDLSGHRSSGIAAMAYARLRNYLGLPKKPIRVYDPVQQLAIVDEDVLQRFQVDTIELGRAFALEDKHWAEWTLPDGTPCLMPAWALPERDHGDWVIRSHASGRV